MQIAFDLIDKKKAKKVYVVGEKILDEAFFNQLRQDIKDTDRKESAGEDMSLEGNKDWLMNS